MTILNKSIVIFDIIKIKILLSGQMNSILIWFWGKGLFLDLQQEQDIQNNYEWQQNMLAIEDRVSSIKEYVDIAFFHHLILKKT